MARSKLVSVKLLAKQMILQNVVSEKFGETPQKLISLHAQTMRYTKSHKPSSAEKKLNK